MLQLIQQLPPALLREWNIEATISEIAKAVRSRSRKAEAPTGLPRSSGQGGRRLFVIHRIRWADWEYELSLEENGEFLCWDVGFDLPLRAGDESKAKLAHIENLKYLTFEAEGSIVWDLGLMRSSRVV